METPGYTPPEAKQSIYKERISSESYLGEKLAEIDALSRGEGVLNFSERETSALLEYEGGLESELYESYKTKIRSMTLDLDWLATDEGRATFSEKTGMTELPNDPESWASFLYDNKDELSKVDPKIRKEISGAGTEFRDKRLLEQFSNSVKPDGTLGETEVEYTERISILFDPEKWVQKNDALRAFKDKLKKEYHALEGEGSDAAEAKRLVLNLYAHRTNISIAGLFDERRSVAKKVDRLGLDSLSDAEKEILGYYTQEKIDQGEAPFVTEQAFREGQVARLDKFSMGASSDYRDGQQLQVGQELIKLADKLGEIWLKNTVSKRELVEAQGLSYESLFEDNIPAEDRKALVEEEMKRLGVLSTIKEFDPDREGPAEDGKLQVYIKPGSKAAGVNLKQRVHKISDDNSNIASLLSVDCSHEVTHGLQIMNSAHIPLKIFERIGGGGSSAFSEGGAMMAQDKVSKMLFGYEGANHPHYIRAMAKRLEGGTYPETVQAFYNSAIVPFQIQLQNGEMTQAEFDKKSHTTLKTAIDRCQRQFRGAKLSSTEANITESRATVYLEQNVLADALKSKGLEKALLLRGMSLENIVTLMKIGFLKLDEVLEPDYDFIKEEWEKVKPKYLRASA